MLLVTDGVVSRDADGRRPAAATVRGARRFDRLRRHALDVGLSVRYRDARYVLPFIIQIWLFVTPVAYPASLVPERWRLLYALNPMAIRRRRLQERAARERPAPARWSSSQSSLSPPRWHPARRTSGPSKDRLWISPEHVRRRDSASAASASATSSARAKQQHDTLRDRIAAAAARPFRRLARGRFRRIDDDLGAQGHHARDSPWRRGRRRRRQRRGQVNAVEDSVAHHRRRLRAKPTFTAASDRCSRSAPAFIPTSPAARTSSSTAPFSACARPRSSGSSTRSSASPEIEEFIDTPVKHYSSGMYVRLGFAVAAHMEPEILIVDEVLAVGDVHFQRKCLGKLDDVARSGRTVLFVSHNMAAIQRLCTSAMLLQHGKLVRAGDVRSIVAAYLGGEARGGFVAVRPHRRRRRFCPLISKMSLDVRSTTPPAPSRSSAGCALRCRTARRAREIGIGVLSCDGIPVFTTNTSDAGLQCPSGPGEFDARVTIPPRYAAGRRLSPRALPVELGRNSRPSRAGAVILRRRGCVAALCRECDAQGLCACRLRAGR